MAIHLITSARGGFSDYEDKGIAGAYKRGYNLDIRKEVDSLTCGQALAEEGLQDILSTSASPSPSASVSLSPSVSPSASTSTTPSPSASASPSASQSPSSSTSPSSSDSPSPSVSFAITTIFRDLINFFVKATDGYTYGFGDTGYIYRRDSDGIWLRVYKDPDGEIVGATERYSDTGKTYLLWATRQTLHEKPLPGDDNFNDVDKVSGWPKTNLTPADWHTMRNVNGAALIANASTLALVGYDDSYTNNALDLIPGNIAKTLVERNGRVVVGTGRASDPTKGINGAIDGEIPLIQVGDDGELHYANLQNSVPLKKFPGGGKVNPGGVTNEIDEVLQFDWDTTAITWVDKQSVGNMSVFGIWGADANTGGIFKYGRKNKNHPMVLSLDHLLDVDEIGAITSVDGTILASYREGTDVGVKAVDSTAKAEAVYEGLDINAQTDRPLNIANWKYVEIICKPLPEGTSFQFWYKLDKDGEFEQAPMEGGSTTFQARGETKAVFLIGEKAEIFEPRIVLTPTGNTTPEIMFPIRIFAD